MEEDDFDGHEGGEDADVAYHRGMGERNYNRLHAIHTTVCLPPPASTRGGIAAHSRVAGLLRVWGGGGGVGRVQGGGGRNVGRCRGASRLQRRVPGRRCPRLPAFSPPFSVHVRAAPHTDAHARTHAALTGSKPPHGTTGWGGVGWVQGGDGGLRGSGSGGGAPERSGGHPTAMGTTGPYLPPQIYQACPQAGIAVGGGRWAIDARRPMFTCGCGWVGAQPIAEAAQCEEQARVEEQLMPQLLRAAGLPDELCDPARLAAHNPFALGGS